MAAGSTSVSAALVLDVRADPAQVADRFAALGWRARSLPPAAQQPADDLLLGAWDGPAGAEAELVDDGLVRVLRLRRAPVAALEALRTLPWRTADEVLAQLGSLDARELVAGVRAAAALADPALVVGLAPLRHHPDGAVRAEAAAVLGALAPELAEQGLALLREHQRRTGANPLWTPAIPLRDRRQLLRWLIHDRGATEPTVRACFADPDCEIQAGAVIASVRCGLRGLGALVERWRPPTVSRDGAAAEDRAALRAIARVAATELAGLALPVAVDERGIQRRGEWMQLADCIAGRPAARRDRLWLLVRSLAEPLPEPGGLPAARAGWRFVPALEHWLGGDELVRAAAGPAAWLAEEPLRAGGDWWQGSWEEARARCAAEGWEIPGADAWECALRGTDGRRFPWGAGLDADAMLAPSPWGCRGHGQGWEWVQGAHGPELRGGDRPVPCWQRRRPEPGERARLRPLRR